MATTPASRKQKGRKQETRDTKGRFVKGTKELNTKILLSTEELVNMYLSSKSSLKMARELNVAKITILRRLRKYDHWDEIKGPSHYVKKEKSMVSERCLGCGIEFTYTRKNRKRLYCSYQCYKNSWSRLHPDTPEQQDIRKEKRVLKEKMKTERAIWFGKFKIMLEKYHKRNIDKLTNLLLDKSLRIKNYTVSRSKRVGVKCDITLTDIRKLILEYYGKPCKYDANRIVTYKNMVFDHLIPISKGGESTKNNIQLISRFSNSVKGSLDEQSFYVLLKWLDTIDPELKKDITIRLAHGIH